MKGYVAMGSVFLSAKLLVWLLSQGTIPSTIAAVTLFWFIPVIPVAITGGWK
jgi:hypothetical protein